MYRWRARLTVLIIVNCTTPRALKPWTHIAAMGHPIATSDWVSAYHWSQLAKASVVYWRDLLGKANALTWRLVVSCVAFRKATYSYSLCVFALDWRPFSVIGMDWLCGLSGNTWRAQLVCPSSFMSHIPWDTRLELFQARALPLLVSWWCFSLVLWFVVSWW